MTESTSSRLTHKDIEAAARRLIAQGQKATTRTIYGEFKRGGMGTIAGWLDKWRGGALERLAGPGQVVIPTSYVLTTVNADMIKYAEYVVELDGYAVKVGRATVIVPKEDWLAVTNSAV